jgi:hypothetical protein
MGDKENPPARPPPHFFVKDDGSTLRIGFRLIGRLSAGGVLIILVWNCFVGLWYWHALRTGGPWMWLAIIFTIPHGIIGLFLVYATLATLLNRTVITVTSEFLTARTGPLPWSGNRTLPTDEIEELNCDQEPDAAERERHYGYRINALTKTAGTVELVKELDRAQALFIKQELARWLKIVDDRCE